MKEQGEIVKIRTTIETRRDKMAYFQMNPFVKWAGGKGQLLSTLLERAPKAFGRYYEPFIGGGAMLLGLAPSKASINDSNTVLINVYRQLKENSNKLIETLQQLDAIPCSKERYYEIRKTYNEKIADNQTSDVEAAALLIWLNKHCFNGLYRVNRKGAFNVPWNTKVNGNSFDEGNLRLISEYLRKNNVTISVGDFEAFCSRIRPGDFVYFDSPYLPVSETAYFTDYTADGFSMDDHVRLAKLYKKLTEKGVYAMLSNHDVSLVYELYGNMGYHIESVEVKRLINRNAAKRTGKEVIITNY